MSVVSLSQSPPTLSLWEILKCLVCEHHAVFSGFRISFYPTALKGCRDIVFTHGVRMGGRAAGKSLSGLYLRNRKV